MQKKILHNIHFHPILIKHIFITLLTFKIIAQLHKRALKKLHSVTCLLCGRTAHNKNKTTIAPLQKHIKYERAAKKLTS